MLTEYKITSQEHMVKLTENAYDKAKAEVNKFTDLADPKLREAIMVMTTFMNVWMEQKEKLEEMRKQWDALNVEKN